MRLNAHTSYNHTAAERNESKGGIMKKATFTVVLLLFVFSYICASPTIKGNRGVLRVFAADPEVYTGRRPTMFLGFYQGFAQAEGLRELHYGLSFTMLVLERFEFAYLIESLDSDFRSQPLSNEFKLKIVTLRTPLLKISPIGQFRFPIGGEGGDNSYGGYLTSTLDLGATRKFLPLRFHVNAGYIMEGDNSTIPLRGAIVYPTKYFDVFIEGGLSDIENTEYMTFTPGIKLKLWGTRTTAGVDFITEGVPENKFNFMFSWLGPFSGAELIPQIGIGTVKGYVYDAKTDEPVKANVILEGDINRVSNSSDDGKFSINELPPGEYTVLVTADGYNKAVQETEVERGRTSKLRIGLMPLVNSFAGTVIDEETGEPIGAQIAIIPDVFLIINVDPETGEFFTEIEKGSYEITVSKEGYSAIWDTITVFSQKTTRRFYELSKIENAGRFNGWISDYDTEKPIGALIRLDDRTFILNDSLTGEFASMLEEGTYPVSIDKVLYHPLKDTVAVKADVTIEKIYKLRMIKEVVEEEEVIEEEVIEEEVIITFSDILFEFDRDYIKKQFHAELDSLADILKAIDKDRIIVQLIGYTCSIGSDSYNIELSRKRVLSVKKYLMERGVSETKLETDFLGEKQPKYDNSTKEGRNRNRRVEIIRQ